MENYNIYDEVGRGTHSFVYKARRKRSIEYVAVKSTAKCRMEKILNEVQFLHKLDSPFVLKFYNWYESQNHIWLIFEYCIGGDLLNLITQDKRLPEAAVQTFGRQLVAGLQYLHCNGVLFCDLKPANILVDEFGSLKLADFGLARRIPTKDTRSDQPLAPGSPNYMAPELFQQQAIHSFASDFWALGCVLFEMATGKQAFTHTVFSELARKIQTEAPELPHDGSDCPMSSSFWDLLERLLHKNPYQRISWDQLLQHPFWHGCFALDKVEMPEQELFAAGSPSSIRVPEVQKSRHCADAAVIESRNFTSESKQDAPGSVSEIEDGSPRSNNNESNSPLRLHNVPSLDETESKRKNPAAKFDRPVSAPVLPVKPTDEQHDNSRANGTKISSQKRSPDSETVENNLAASRGYDEQSNNADVTERAKLPSTAPAVATERRSPGRTRLLETAFNRDGKPGSGLRKLSTLLFTPGDFCTKPIVWNDKIELLILPSNNQELLPFTAMTTDQLLSSNTETLERHLMEIYINLKSSDMDTDETAALMAQLFTYCCHPKLANVIINSSILALLTKMLAGDPSRSPQRPPVLVGMTCLIVGVLFRFAAFFAPASTDQMQSLLQALAVIAEQPSSITSNPREDSSGNGLDPRRLAISTLGVVLVYMSTRKEWQVATSSWDRLISALRDDDLVVRHYAARTLCNALSSCHDESLLAKLSNEQTIAILTRSIVEYSDIHGKRPEKSYVLGVWATATQAVALVLQHLRSPAAKSKSMSAQKCSVLLLLAKRSTIRALWHGFRSGVTADQPDLSLASLNVLNVFLELKLDGCRDTVWEAIEMARSDFLERVVTFPEVITVFEANARFNGCRRNQSKRDRPFEAAVGDNDKSDEGSSTLLQAKVVILLYLGIQSSRTFIDRCLQAQVMRVVEQSFAPLATIVRNDQHRRESATLSNSIATTTASSSSTNSSPEIRPALRSPNDIQAVDGLSPSDVHLLQCLMNLVKMSIHRALKLGAECISANARVSESGTGRITIEATSFNLLHSLLRSPACRLQLVHYFVANANKHYTFFLRLVTKMLAEFSNESIDEDADKTTVGVSLGHILLRLFQCATTDAREIVTVESEILYLNLLPALTDLIARDAGSISTDNSAELSVTSIRIIYLVLLQFDDNETEPQISKYRETFVRKCLFPRLCSLLMNDHGHNENVWRFVVELLFGLLSKEESLLASADAQLLVPAIVQLLDTPTRRNYHSLPSSATKMVKMVLLRGKQGADQQLYDAGIAKYLLSALRFATDEALGGCLMDLLEILLQLLHNRYEEVRKAGSSVLTPPPSQFDTLRECGPLVAQLCAVLDDRASPPKSDTTDAGVDGAAPRQRTVTRDHETAVADLASRCLIFLSQLFAEKLNEVLFAAEDDRGSKSVVSRSFLLCLNRPDATSSAVTLRVLLTLKNCLRSQSNNSSVASRWFAANPKFGRLLKRLARSGSVKQHQTTKGKGATTSEQIAKTAAEIERLCDAISPPRQS